MRAAARARTTGGALGGLQSTSYLSGEKAFVGVRLAGLRWRALQLMHKVVRQHGGLMRSLRVLAIAAIAAGLTTCSKATAPKSPLEGAWIANLPSQTVLSLHLTVADTVVTGSGALGTLTNPTTLPLTVSGWYVPPNASLSLFGTGDPMTLVASLSGSTLTGTLSGGGYANLAVTFNKH